MFVGHVTGKRQKISAMTLLKSVSSHPSWSLDSRATDR
ncbi:unnamed protein product [Strongylus vulgaris]|uniref:Uncharacterized protein n=1 Tax=Strongylus vulgaris TaxID=40348 RepID=A0A3P7KDX3_STRVU|nr:unnamed protein product [Strongylus vulgaris]